MIQDRLGPVLAIALVAACIVVGFMGTGANWSKMRFLALGPDSASSGGGQSIPTAANNAERGTTTGANGPGGLGTSASGDGSSTLSPMLRRRPQTDSTLALTENTFSNNATATAASKTVTAGDGASGGTNSSAASGGAGQASGDGGGLSGASVSSGGGRMATIAARSVKGEPTFPVPSTSAPEPTVGVAPLSNNTGADEVSANATSSSGILLTGQTSGRGRLAPDATIVWQGSVNQANVWNHGPNWAGGAVPGPNDTAQFDNTANGSNLAPSIGATNTSIGAILFAAGTTNSYDISGTATLTLGSATVSGITNASDTNQRISVSNITAPVSQTWTVAGAGNLSISSNIALAAGVTLTLDGSSTGAGTISGVISGGTAGTTAIVKNGSGTWTLAGTNTTTGNVIVNGGTLFLTGSLPQSNSRTVTVNNVGTTFAGTGTISTPGTPASDRTTINAGANLAPGLGGNTIGTLTVGALTLAANSNFRVDINGPGAGQFDQVVTLATGASSTVVTGSNLLVHVGGVLTAGQMFQIINRTASGAWGGGMFVQGNQVIADNGDIFTIAYNGNGVFLTFTGQNAIPEPGTWFMGGLAVTALVALQWRRLKRLPLPT